MSRVAIGEPHNWEHAQEAFTKKNIVECVSCVPSLGLPQMVGVSHEEIQLSVIHEPGVGGENWAHYRLALWPKKKRATEEDRAQVNQFTSSLTGKSPVTGGAVKTSVLGHLVREQALGIKEAASGASQYSSPTPSRRRRGCTPKYGVHLVPWQHAACRVQNA